MVGYSRDTQITPESPGSETQRQSSQSMPSPNQPRPETIVMVRTRSAARIASCAISGGVGTSGVEGAVIFRGQANARGANMRGAGVGGVGATGGAGVSGASAHAGAGP